MTTENNTNELINAINGKENNMEIKMNEEAIVNNITDEVYDLLIEYNHNATRYGVECLVKNAWRNKASLRNILRKHPMWNEEKQQIVFKSQYNREINTEVVDNFFRFARQAANEIATGKGEDYDKVDGELWSLFCVVKANLAQYMENETVDKINEMYPDIKVHYNAKLSRVINKICTSVYHLDQYVADKIEIIRDENGEPVTNEDGYYATQTVKCKPYNAEYTKFADAVNPLKIERWTVFSINPVDFLTMSFGNTWSSCHTIDKSNKRRSPGTHYHGMYCGGTLSYALDGTTIIVYSVDNGYDGTTGARWNGILYRGFETQDKIIRNLIHYEGNVMVQARLYPQENDGGVDLYKTFREIEEKTIADCLGKPNLWKYERGCSAAIRYITTDEYAHHYHDYECYDSVGVCIIKGEDDKYNGNDDCMTVGHAGIDIDTGDEIPYGSEYDGYLSTTETLRCAKCGEPINEDDAIWIDGEAYCNDCAIYCDYHNEYEVNEGDHYYVSNYGYVCLDGIDDGVANGDFYRCESCGEIYLDGSDGYYTEDGDWYCCSYCANRDGFVWSPEHEYLINKSDAVRIEGEWYEEDDVVPCPCCGTLVKASDICEMPDGSYVCSQCSEFVAEESATA